MAIEQIWRHGRSSVLVSDLAGGRAAYTAIAALGAMLFWLSEAHPALMPEWGPWEFSPVEYGASALTLFWFLRGIARVPDEARPATWRSAAFLIGLLAIYAVLQTRFEYWSQHMFYLNRIQHVVMHHFGPFLIALGAASEVLKQGAPRWVRRMVESRWVTGAISLLQQPVIAGLLFSGSFFFWLIPNVHFRAMLDPRLYAVMNWSMVLDGILFWSLVLDARPKPPARVSFGTRAALAVAVMFPQILFGSIIALWTRDLYPYYDLCGRLIPTMSAQADQQIGGVIIWIPPAMMSIVAAILVLVAVKNHEDAIEETDPDAIHLANLARRWTGR
jgi:putative membrane protein